MKFPSLLGRDAVVALPKRFNYESMHHFIQEVSRKRGAFRSPEIIFDFSTLEFITPDGIVALANTIEHFKQTKARIQFANCKLPTDANKYLDDAGFFRHYTKKKIFSENNPRDTTVPLEIFSADQYTSYLYFKLTPWIGRATNLSTNTLESIRACLEEVFHNIEYHAGVSTGCVFAQHFPRKKRIHIAISDFGIGIPSRVRTKEPDASDPEALKMAVREGFTTKTNVRNRGVGLSLLTKHITQKNSGTVLIHSGSAYLSATPGPNPSSTSITSRHTTWQYPGTLVHVELRTDTLEKLESEAAPEEFQW